MIYMTRRKFQLYLKEDFRETLEYLRSKERFRYSETIHVALDLLFSGVEGPEVQTIRKSINERQNSA